MKICLSVFEQQGVHFAARFLENLETNMKGILCAQGRGSEVFTIKGDDSVQVDQEAQAEARRLGITFVKGLDKKGEHQS